MKLTKVLLVPSLVFGSSLIGTDASAQLVPPGASGSTTTSVYTQSVTRTSATTANFSRDQTFVISGSNVDVGTITATGGTLGGITEMSPAGKTVSALPTDQMSFAGYNVTFLEIMDIFSDFSNHADKLVADVHGNRDCPAGPVIPVVDMEVGTADGGFKDFDEDICSSGPGNINLFQPESLFRFRLYKRLHGSHTVLF